MELVQMKYLSAAVGAFASLLGLMLYGLVVVGGLPFGGDLVDLENRDKLFHALLVTAGLSVVASAICALKPFIGYWMMIATSIAWFLVALSIIISVRSNTYPSDPSYVIAIGVTFLFVLPTILTALSAFFLRKTAIKR